MNETLLNLARFLFQNCPTNYTRRHARRRFPHVFKSPLSGNRLFDTNMSKTFENVKRNVMNIQDTRATSVKRVDRLKRETKEKIRERNE